MSRSHKRSGPHSGCPPATSGRRKSTNKSVNAKRRPGKPRPSDGEPPKWIAKDGKGAKSLIDAPESKERPTPLDERGLERGSGVESKLPPKPDNIKAGKPNGVSPMPWKVHQLYQGGVLESDGILLQQGKPVCCSQASRARAENRNAMIQRSLRDERARQAGTRDAVRQIAAEAKSMGTAPPLPAVPPMKLSLADLIKRNELYPATVHNLAMATVQLHMRGRAPLQMGSAMAADALFRTALKSVQFTQGGMRNLPIVVGSPQPPPGQGPGGAGGGKQPATDPEYQPSGPLPARIAGPEWDDAPFPFYVYAKRSLLSRVIALPVVLAAWPLRLFLSAARRIALLDWGNVGGPGFVPIQRVLDPDPVQAETLQQLRLALAENREPRSSAWSYGLFHRLHNLLIALSTLSNSICPVIEVVPRAVTRTPPGMIDIRPSDRVATAYPDRPNYLRTSTLYYLRWFTARDIVEHEEVTNMLTETMRGANTPAEWKNYRRKAIALNSAHNADAEIWAAASEGSYDMAVLRAQNQFIDRLDLETNRMVDFPDEPRGVPARTIALWSAVAIVLARFALNPALRTTLLRQLTADFDAATLVASCSARLAQRLVVFGHQCLTLVILPVLWLARFIGLPEPLLW